MQIRRRQRKKRAEVFSHILGFRYSAVRYTFQVNRSWTIPRYHMPMVTGTPTRTRYAVLVFVYLAAFITYLDRVCLSVAAPAMQAELGISQVGFGWVFTVFYIAYSVFEMPASWLGHLFGQWQVRV